MSLRILMSSVAAIALLAGGAAAKVGVTSATDGDPLGKPPGANERVLRIGIDVQANELVTTGTNDRAHLVFLDGTSVTVGPNAQLTIDRFVYDPDAKKGDLAITATKGVFRLVGGKISKGSPVTVTTPSGTIGIRGGITIFSATNLQTIANFIFGYSMTVTGAGRSTVATRPGTQVIVNSGSAPGLPTLLPPGGLNSDMALLETGTNRSGPQTAEQGAQAFAVQNSSQPFLQNTMPRPATSTPQTNAVSDANTQVQTEYAKPPTQSAPPPPPPPNPRTTQTLNGYASGLIVAYENNVLTAGNAIGNQDGSTTRTPEVLVSRPTDLTISTNAETGKATGTIVIRGLNGTVLSPVATLQLGTMQNNSQNFFTDNAHYAMSTSDDPNRPSTLRVLINNVPLPNETQLVSGAVNAASPHPVPVIGTPGACACEYLTWGWWQSIIDYTGNYRHGQTDVISAAPYVAGTLANSVNMPQTGQATYTGFMVGNVQNGADRYNAAGSYSSTWSFAARAGSFGGSFDNRTYTGAIVATPGTGGVSFVGGMVGSGGQVGTVAGSFFSAPGDAAKYQAGSFAIGQNSSTYKASGVFAGQR
jgi:hypothetical protein